MDYVVEVNSTDGVDRSNGSDTTFLMHNVS